MAWLLWLLALPFTPLSPSRDFAGSRGFSYVHPKFSAITTPGDAPPAAMDVSEISF